MTNSMSYPSHTHTKTTSTSNETKPSTTTAFDINSWIQHGSLCKTSCYNQLYEEEELEQRTTSFCSSTNNTCYSTEDNSSSNDSVDDVYDIKDTGFDSSDWLQGHQCDHHSAQLTSSQQGLSSEKTLQSLDLSRLKIGALEEYSKISHTSKLESIQNIINQTMLGKKKKQREWRSAIDPKSGRSYYYDKHTRETQWHKPLELATKAERRAIVDKERKQREFFKAMEKNILKCMKVGQLPGSQAFEQEDTVKSLPNKTKVLSKRQKPKPQLLRTISSMDHELLQELTNIELESQSFAMTTSPDSASTSFFDSLPQPESQVHSLHSLSSFSTSSSNYENYSKSSEFESLDKSDVRSSTASKLSYSLPASKCNSKFIPKPKLSKRNTCGTMYVSTTMAAPDKDATIKCVCGVYRTHIIHSLNDATYRPKFDEYEIFNDVINSGSRNTNNTPGRNKAEIVEADFGIELTISSDEDNGVAPSLEEIADFFRFIFYKAQLENDTIIMSLIYVERLLRETNGGVRPNLLNWKSLLFSCMIMASKVWDDLSMWNVDFSQASPAGVIFSLKRINELELAVLSCLNYNVKVPASEYAKYYFLMRSMLIRSGLAGEEFRSSKPLDMEGAKKFEIVTSSYNAKPTITRAPLRRSKSAGNDGQGENESPIRPSTVALEQLVNMQIKG